MHRPEIWITLVITGHLSFNRFIIATSFFSSPSIRQPFVDHFRLRSLRRSLQACYHHRVGDHVQLRFLQSLVFIPTKTGRSRHVSSHVRA